MCLDSYFSIYFNTDIKIPQNSETYVWKRIGRYFETIFRTNVFFLKDMQTFNAT